MAWWHRVRGRVGRRGSALLAFAFVDVIIGRSLIDPVQQAQAAALPSYRAMLAVAPLAVWGVLWLAVGGVCLVQAFARDDRVGYFAAVSIKVVWGAAFAASAVIWHAPRALNGAATWLVVAALVHLISGGIPGPVLYGEEERGVDGER